MKPIIPALALLSATAAARGQLVITEVMAASVHTTGSTNGDWWELTNTGSSSVSLDGYKWDDTPETPPSPSSFPDGLTIKPGESIIILDENPGNVAAWKNAWGLSASTQVLNSTQVPGFSGLSADGDEVNLHDAGGNLVSSVSFGESQPGRSFVFHRDGTPVIGRYSGGWNGAFPSSLAPGDGASPGDSRLHFTTSPVRFARHAYRAEIAAVQPASNAIPTFSAITLPPFLTLTAGPAGKATLVNNRPLTLQDAGLHRVDIVATAGPQTVRKDFMLAVLNPVPPLVLNEYNAVSPENYLNGGDASADEDGGAASVDTHFGRVRGNGGQWVEFVVVGTAPVDMRGWVLEIGTDNTTGFIPRNHLVLSNHDNWQAVPPGTILTFIDRTTAQGGRDTGFAIRNNSATTGDIWTNIWMGDPTFLTHTGAGANGYTVTEGVVSGILINNNDTQFRVRNSQGQIVYGPAGEGIGLPSGLNSKEVLELEGDPSVLVSPTDIASSTAYGYDDSASGSTFGSPNTWTEGTDTITQQFNVIPPAEIAVEQAPGAAVADGADVSFGNVATGTNATRTFTIRNVGVADLTGLTITRDGAHAADFTITASPVAPVPGPLGSTVFTVKFAPTTAGTKTAAIHIASNDGDEPSYDITLTGSAFAKAPEISVQQPAGSELTDGKTKKSFGTVKIGKKSAAKTFTIRNTGTANLTGLALAVKGKHAKDFTVTKPAKTTLTPGASTTFKVTFKPAAKGTRSATLQLKSNDANENPFDIPVTGSGAKK